MNAFAKDTGAAAEAVAKLLENPSPEAAAAILAKLDTLLPDDPAMAAVIAEAMANEFSVGRDVPGAPQKEEITQAEAEKLYEEIMSK